MGLEIKLSVDELQKRKLMVATPMYGGNCAGMYSRSIADLSALCASYGVVVKFYFLFNESLITRARNYCVDEFMRSDCTHLMFIDSDIGFNAQDVIALLALQSPDAKDDQYDILAGPYPKKCFHNTTTIETEDGTKTIAWIVDNQYSGKVKSVNSNNQVEWKNITNWWAEKNTGKKWVSLQTTSACKDSKITPRGMLKVTEDHEVAFIENILDPDNIKIKYTEAKNMKGKYSVVTSLQNKGNNYNRIPLLNKEQLSIMIGAICGDGCVINGGFVYGHGPKQTPLTKAIYSALPYGNIRITDKGSTIGFVNGQTKELSKIMYDNGQKTIKNVIHLIDEKALAVMYQDDGNRYFYPEHDSSEEITDRTWWVNEDTAVVKRTSVPEGECWVRGRSLNSSKMTNEGSCSIATMSFTLEDNILLSNHIFEKYGIKSTIGGNQNKKYFLKFDRKNTVKFHNLIAPYVHESMNYKLNNSARNIPKKSICNKPLNISAKEIKDVLYIEGNGSKLYDVEVEDNHNLFVNDGILVHNCISWEKIKTAVDKGMADENPNNLEKYVGDFVFNPAAGQGSIPLGEPVEILEAGTGFMMIRRNTFEKFAASYPHQFYRPDHVRTEHFDGSREIVAYFDTPIDHKRTNLDNELKDFLIKNPKATMDEIMGFVKSPNESSLGIDYSKRYLSEDYMFCQWVRKIGLKLWFCPWMKLQHVGTMVFGGSLVDLAQIGTAATADPSKIKKK